MEVLLRPPRATYEIADRYHRGNTVLVLCSSASVPGKNYHIESRSRNECCKKSARDKNGNTGRTLPPCACVLGVSTFSALLIRSDRRLRSLYSPGFWSIVDYSGPWNLHAGRFDLARVSVTRVLKQFETRASKDDRVWSTKKRSIPDSSTFQKPPTWGNCDIMPSTTKRPFPSGLNRERCPIHSRIPARQNETASGVSSPRRVAFRPPHASRGRNPNCGHHCGARDGARRCKCRGRID